ncbi:MAG: DNA-binding protein [Magnetovibrio sp.]|nr:DNA-binding protein [Magnetovibrio sp.]|tara:strand:+ start:1850 stop:2323 length:474 start_codon:yes stop_codon:yes gene_type:complete
MFANSNALIERLEKLEIETQTFYNPAVHTVEVAKALRGALSGGHSKNLFLKDKKGCFWLIITLEDKAIDLKALRRLIRSAQLSLGKPDKLQEILGILPGAVTPFSIINDKKQLVKVVLDQDLLNFHPLVNTATTQISKKGLLTFIEDCGHKPIILTL